MKSAHTANSSTAAQNSFSASSVLPSISVSRRNGLTKRSNSSSARGAPCLYKAAACNAQSQISMHLESGSVLFLCFMKVSIWHQLHAGNLGNVIEPRNQFRISKTGRQHQMPFSILRIKNPLQLSRKPSHVRRINTANARQNDLRREDGRKIRSQCPTPPARHFSARQSEDG